MDSYGTDKPDLRFDVLLHDFSAFAEAGAFQAFKDALETGAADQAEAAAKGITTAGGAVKELVMPGAASYSRKQIEELEAHAKIYKARGLAWMKVAGDATAPHFEGGVGKFFTGQEAAICAALGAVSGDLILICADAKKRIACTALGAVRSKLGRENGLTANRAGATPHFAFAWVVDFPLFEWNDDENRWEAAHHMFSYPQEQFHATLETDPGAVKGDLYDLVLNGYELASGSIRIHESELQKRIFNIVGYDPADAESKFGFLLEAFKYGAPPHGGIAPGLDRLVMLMAGETSIKEVIAFPKNSFAQGLMDDSPSPASEEQLKELHLVIKE
jgi:aspartyl-tRNA synthetase